MTFKQTQESTEYLKIKPALGSRAPPVTKEPLSADRPTQLLPLAVPYYPSQDSTPRSFLRHTRGMSCCTQTSTHGGGSEGKQAYLDVASSTSQPKSQAVLLSWPQGVT